MASKPKMRWRDKDKKRLSNLVRQYNRKRTLLIKQVPELAEILPPKLTVEDLRKQIHTRNDFNYITGAIQRFGKKDATKIIVTDSGHRVTKWERDELINANRRRNAKRAAERKKVEERVSHEKGTMGNIHKYQYRPRKLNWRKMDKASWNKFREQLDKEVWDNYSEKQKQQYVINYLQSLKTMYGSDALAELGKLLYKLDADDIGDAMFDDSILNIDYQYSNEGDLGYARNILNHWIDWIRKNRPDIDINAALDSKQPKRSQKGNVFYGVDVKH